MPGHSPSYPAPLAAAGRDLVAEQEVMNASLAPNASALACGADAGAREAVLATRALLPA